MQGKAELAQAAPRRDTPRRILPHGVVRDGLRIERFQTPERKIGRGHDPGFDEAHAVHPPPHRVVAHRRFSRLVEGAHPFLAVALVGGDVAVELDDVAPVPRMAPGAVLLLAHDVEQVPRGENPTPGVDDHVRADGAGARALHGAARDDHRPGESGGDGNGLAEHPLDPSNAQGDGPRPSRDTRLRTRDGRLGQRRLRCETGTGQPNRRSVRFRPDCRRSSHRVRTVPVHYSHPRTRTRRGVCASTQVEVGAFARTSPQAAHPDIQYHFFPFLLEGWRPSRSESGFCVCVGTLRERSRGTLRLACADPTAPPLIDFNYLDDPRDLDDLRTCVHQAREVVSQHAFDPFRGDAVRPWAAARDDAEIDAVIRESAESAYHPCGTCRMGDDPMSVVDPQCRVHGMEGLRVVDSSIIPSIVSGNLNAPTMMVGEKASDMILGRTALAPSNAGFFGAA